MKSRILKSQKNNDLRSKRAGCGEGFEDVGGHHGYLRHGEGNCWQGAPFKALRPVEENEVATSRCSHASNILKFDVRTLLASVNKNNTFLKARTTKQLRGSAAGQFRANRVDTLKSEIQPLEFVGFQETIVRKQVHFSGQGEYNYNLADGSVGDNTSLHDGVNYREQKKAFCSDCKTPLGTVKEG